MTPTQVLYRALGVPDIISTGYRPTAAAIRLAALTSVSDDDLRYRSRPAQAPRLSAEDERHYIHNSLAVAIERFSHDLDAGRLDPFIVGERLDVEGLNLATVIEKITNDVASVFESDPTKFPFSVKPDVITRALRTLMSTLHEYVADHPRQA